MVSSLRYLQVAALAHCLLGASADLWPGPVNPSLVTQCDHIPDLTSPRGYFSYYTYEGSERKFKEVCSFDAAGRYNKGAVCDLNSQFYSQSGQDQLVAKLLDNKRGGYFIDLAANDWCELSNSLALEKNYGWHGLCIEGSNGYVPGLASNRSCNAIISVTSKVDNEKVKFVGRGVYGGIVDEGMDNSPAFIRGTKSKPITLAAVTLATILKAFNAPSVIDYMSLDVEGAEHNVLMGFDFSKYKIRIMTVERPTPSVHHILSSNGYWWVKSISPYGETLYVHKSFEGINELMRTSPSCTGDVQGTSWKVKKTSTHPYLLNPRWVEKK